MNACSTALLAAASAALFVATSEVSAQQRQLRFGSPWPTTSNLHAGIVRFAEEIDRESKGATKVNVYPDSQLGDIQALINGLQTGTVDMTYLAIGNANVLKGGQQLNLAYVPYLFRSKAAAEEIANSELFQKMYDDVAKQSGVRIFAVYGQRSPRGVHNSKKPVATPNDMKGLKIRIPPIDGMRAFITTVGAQPVVLGLGDTYQAISRGQVDGHENGIDAAIAFKWFEVAKYWTETAHMYETAAWYIQEKLWQAMSAAEREAFIRSARAGGAVMTKLGEEIEVKGLETMKANGVTITQPNRAAFQEALKDVYKQYEGKVWPAGAVERIRAMQN